MEVLNSIILVTFSNTEPLINIEEVLEVEKYIGLNFPKEYVDHILLYNGGQCDPNVFKFNEKGVLTESCIDWFLAIYEGEYDNLKNYIDTYKLEEKRLPYQMIPIAHDPGGNLICISCIGQDVGFVYFWDHENEVNYKVSDDSNYSNLFLIAESFNEFISNLKEDFQ
jgi:hypothetical protein